MRNGKWFRRCGLPAGDAKNIGNPDPTGILSPSIYMSFWRRMVASFDRKESLL
jgi:hypothetical protein